jgi:hypothetical protein
MHILSSVKEAMAKIEKAQSKWEALPGAPPL